MRNFTTNVSKILVLKSTSEQIFSRKLPLGAPDWKISLKILLASLKKNPTLPVRSKIHHRKVEGEGVVDKTWNVPNNSLTTNQLYSHIINLSFLPPWDGLLWNQPLLLTKTVHQGRELRQQLKNGSSVENENGRNMLFYYFLLFY